MQNERKNRVARALAEAHFGVESGISRIFRLSLADEAAEDSEQEPVKLLEINSDTVPVGIQPVYFGPHARSGLDYPSIIVEITPEEFERLVRRELELPGGWRIADEYVPSPAARAAS
jgi:hypothetical protein